MQWRREGATLPAGSIVQLGALVLPHADTAAAGTYSCHGPDGRLLRSLALRLGCECLPRERGWHGEGELGIGFKAGKGRAWRGARESGLGRGVRLEG